jgi:hypothetical protein
MVPPLAAFVILLSTPQATPLEESAGLSLVVIVEGWSEFHYAGGPRLERAGDTLVVSRGRATSKGLKPHDECDPFRVPPAATKEKTLAGPVAIRPARPAPPRTLPSSNVVYVVSGDRRYHRADCSKMGVGARRVLIELLGRQHVPCPVCKPPVRPASK